MRCGCGRIDSSVGMRGVFRLSVKSKRFLRPLIGVVVAYAVAAQSLLIALGGFALPAHANADPAAFELCLHDAQGEGDLPAGTRDQSGCSKLRRIKWPTACSSAALRCRTGRIRASCAKASARYAGPIRGRFQTLLDKSSRRRPLADEDGRLRKRSRHPDPMSRLPCICMGP
jgi:hypothetical protein